GCRAALRRLRAGGRRLGAALDRRGRIGWPASTGGGSAAHRTLVADRPRPAPQAVFDVIYAIGYWPGEPKRYRVLNMAETLRGAGYAVHVMPYERIADVARQGWSARALVLFRAEYDRLAGIGEALSYARATGVRLVYDIDDLLFDETLAPRIDGLRRLGPFGRRRFVAAMRGYRRLLRECQLTTVSTTPLARAAEAMGQPSRVVPNGLNLVQLRTAEALAARPPTGDGSVRVGYFSGSATHQRDFAACDTALHEAMARHPRLRFRLVGPLDLDPRWDRYEGRIERLPFQAPDRLLHCIAECDINLAPLELGNPFCEAKSELKFFEAAAVGVPTIASASEPFAAAIEHGVSGCVARTTDDWRHALDALIAAPDRRVAMGVAARQRALSRHAPAAILPQLVAALGLPPR
ncbi:MAG: glycosyltransferase, partial [Alphaproteobacteria bacterium]|nr:glycosyltransferase [Alphaproteobacteria bacterium]